MTYYEAIMNMDVDAMAAQLAALVSESENKCLRQLAAQGLQYKAYGVSPKIQMEIYKHMLESEIDEDID